MCRADQLAPTCPTFPGPVPLAQAHVVQDIPSWGDTMKGQGRHLPTQSCIHSHHPPPSHPPESSVLTLSRHSFGHTRACVPTCMTDGGHCCHLTQAGKGVRKPRAHNMPKTTLPQGQVLGFETEFGGPCSNSTPSPMIICFLCQLGQAVVPEDLITH